MEKIRTERLDCYYLFPGNHPLIETPIGIFPSWRSFDNYLNFRANIEIPDELTTGSPAAQRSKIMILQAVA